jgi:arylsulfatase A-like enzyme
MDNLLLVTVDSLRADHAGWHGYDRPTTPNLDTIATSAHAFENAFAHACSTRPSFPSILTSSYPLMYGGFERIAAGRTLVSEALAAGGYRCGGFHSNLYLSADFGYGRGFETLYDSKSDPSPTARLRQLVKDRLDEDGLPYRLLARGFEVAERRTGTNVGSAYVAADEITDRAIAWARGADADTPQFLWVHYMDVHHPYVPPARHQRAFREEPVSERRAVQLRRKMIEAPRGVTDAELDTIGDLYDAEIRFADAEIARLVEAVRAAWEGDTALAVTADHGEEFREHGRFSHHATFHDEVLHVPLLVDVGDDGGRHDELVGLLDVAPTLVDYAGLERPENFYGESLRGPIEGAGWERTAVIGDWQSNAGEPRFAYRDADWKYVRRSEGVELYDLGADPGETTNVAEEHADVADRLDERIDAHERAVAATETDLGTVEMDEGVKQRLRDLGYQE